ncbi:MULTISPECIES: HlyD family secretion protein [Bradyrhizobium]|uniref:Multidrug resistance efflux pump n=1 Tax=Bradyrhizobium elkanii TaxID=29448 RepID=A0A8I2C2V0_BRAEL|nr:MULTISPECIES: biotin/lipoyl-binding protein [Bradyrhizobium]MBP1291232.1 multidrug resistance efflux pump [Bradyrhizobium elkanii]MCP1928454.1 multidrug resistance efflux pump [Bradyrhizobium elkanii]MCP1973055.1 multidrug resistance efflux pump [Bradyrhizobium elkanii]MCS3580932.1 multidrug resistance efflux pump [Bradyrhizobium elkanii]MCS3723808.1 multidrug resistance efflux pump [Bradyrhizobium elkanii]
MLIILTLYIVLVWLLFTKFKLVKWGWGSGAVTVLLGAFILSVFLAMFNYLTPSGSFVVISRVMEVAPNVAGEVIEIPVKPNEPVTAGAVLFRIDPAPFRYKVNQLEASLAQARQQVKQLKASYEQATANVDGLTKQLAFHTQRLADYRKLVSEDAQAVFKLQDVQAQYDTVEFQLQAAKATQLSAQLAMESEIGGVNTSVAQILAQLDHAKWELEQTTIRAVGDGVVTIMALSVGDRAMPARSVMSFIVADDVVITGMFAPNGFRTIKPGAQVKLVFDDDPGHIHEATVMAIPQGVGQGQIAVSATLARVGSIGGAKVYPAAISIPKTIDRSQLRLGMPGTATVFADNAGVIGLLMSILVWIGSYTAYL